MMHAVFSFLITPIGRYVGIALVIFGVFFYALNIVQTRQDQLTRSKIEAAQQEKTNAAKSEFDRVIGGDDSRVRTFDRD